MKLPIIKQIYAKTISSELIEVKPIGDEYFKIKLLEERRRKAKKILDKKNEK